MVNEQEEGETDGSIKVHCRIHVVYHMRDQNCIVQRDKTNLKHRKIKRKPKEL